MDTKFINFMMNLASLNVKPERVTLLPMMPICVRITKG